MTDLATVPRPADAALPTITGGDMRGALDLMRDHVQTLDLVEKFVTTIVDTPFIPDAHWPLPVGVQAKEMPNRNPRLRHRGETEENWRIRRSIAIASGTGAVLTGLPLGLDPLTALAQVFIVKGRPGLHTKLKVALAQSRGHKVWDEEYGPERVTVAGQRRGSDDVARITITIEQAVQAKWTDNDTYEKTPADMLWSRAASRVVDRIAGDVVFGLPSLEDLEDAPEPAERDRPPAATATAREGSGAAAAAGSSSDTLRALVDGTARREAEASVALDHDQTHAFPPPEVEPEQSTDPAPQPIDEAQWRRICARFVELEVTGEGQTAKRLRVLGQLVGRSITRGSELTADEAQLVLDNLAGGAGARLVDKVLGRHVAEIRETERQIRQQPEPTGPPLPGEQESRPDPWGINDQPGAATQEDVEAEADELLGEGRPAALEGVVDPWGEQ